MKKIVIFLHGEDCPSFAYLGKIHQNYQKLSGQKINWHCISGHLNKDDDNFKKVSKAIAEADIFICDSDNTNVQGQVEKLTFDNDCRKKLRQALGEIKRRNPKIKVFIKNFFYVNPDQIESLTKFGQIIEEWVDAKVIEEIKK